MTTWCSWRLMRKTVLSSLLAAWSVGDALHKKWGLPENISRGTSQNLWSLLTLKKIFSALLEMPVPYPLLQRRREPMGDGQQIPLHPFAVAACYLDLPWDVPFPCQAVDRLAIAYSLAQSVRLSYWEQRIDQWVAATRTIPEDMANTGAVGRKHCTIAVTRCFSFFETNIPFHTQRFILWKSCNSSDLWSWSKRNTFHHQMANRMRGWSQTQLQGQTPSQTQMCVSATCPQVGFCWARIVWARWWASCLHWKIRQGFLALAKCNGAQAQWTNAVVACDKGAEVPSSCSFHSRVLFGRILGALEESLLATCCNGVIRWTWSLTP